MRVRIRRFSELRLADSKTRHPKRVAVSTGQSDLKRFVRRHMPPVSAIPGGDPEGCVARTATLQLPIHR